MMLPPMEMLAAVGFIVFIAIFISSTFGFGDALVAMPLLAYVLDLSVVAPLVALVSTTTSFIIVWRDWRTIRLRPMAWLLVSALMAVPLGIYISNVVDAWLVKRILAVIIIVFAGYNLLSPPLVRLTNDKWGLVFGALSGVFGGAYNISGPPVVLYGTLRGWSPDFFRVALQGYFFPISLGVVLSRWYDGDYTPTTYIYYSICLPIVWLAIWAGRWANGRIREPVIFQKFLQILLLVLGGTLFL